MVERVRPGEPPEEVVPRLERRVADLLGKPAAVLFPTGTMAQQVALRIHADKRGVRTVAFHPQCHLEVHEHKGYAVVHGLAARLVGDRHRLIRMVDLEAVAEPVAALLLELPQRDIGGQLPPWDELAKQAGWARSRGAAAHLDGARLWEAQPFYERPHAEIAALFDTVYVSLYKGLMGPYGAVLAGDEQFVAHATVWRNRLGGNMARGWPVALAADRGLDDLLPRMPEFLARARVVAGLLTGVAGVQVVPDPPQTPLFHVHLDAAPEAVEAAAAELAAQRRIHTFGRVRTSTSPRSCSFEITVGEQFDDFTDEEVAEHLATMAELACGA
jgi:threonine aldolase